MSRRNLFDALSFGRQLQPTHYLQPEAGSADAQSVFSILLTNVIDADAQPKKITLSGVGRVLNDYYPAKPAPSLDSPKLFLLDGVISGSASSDLSSGVSITTFLEPEVITDANVSGAAAIQGTKIYPDFGDQTVATSGSYELLDASAYSVSVQQETLTSSQTLTIPDKTGTLAYVAGSNGQIPYNNAGAQDAANLFYNSSKGVFGYGLGGNTVFQATSKSTGVTINAPCGRIYMNGAALSADTTVTFTVTNSSVSLNDVVILNHAAGGTAGAYLLNAQAANNSFAINVTNISTGSLSEAIQISFAIIKANA